MWPKFICFFFSRWTFGRISAMDGVSAALHQVLSEKLGEPAPEAKGAKIGPDTSSMNVTPRGKAPPKPKAKAKVSAAQGTKRKAESDQVDSGKFFTPGDDTPKDKGKVPKCVQRLHEVVGEEGLAGLNPQKLRKLLSPKEYNNFANNFRLSLNGEQKSDYKQLSKQEQESWLCQWALDPQACKHEGYNTNFVFSQEMKVADTNWVLQSVLEGPNYLNDKIAVQALIDAGELESRPCKYQSLAAKGYMEYKVTSEFLRLMKGKRQENGVSSMADLKAEEAAEVKDAINATEIDTDLRKTTGKKVSKVKVEVPGAAELKKANVKREACLRTLKRKTDLVKQDLMKITAELIPKLHVKGYPDSMVQFYTSHVNGVEEVVATAHSLYGKEVFVPVELDPAKRSTVEESIETLEAMVAEVAEKKSIFEKEYGCDLRRISGHAK